MKNRKNPDRTDRDARDMQTATRKTKVCWSRSCFRRRSNSIRKRSCWILVNIFLTSKFTSFFYTDHFVFNAGTKLRQEPAHCHRKIVCFYTTTHSNIYQRRVSKSHFGPLLLCLAPLDQSLESILKASITVQNF